MTGTLFGRLVLVYVATLIVVGGSIGALALRAQQEFALEADQRLNVDLAANLATEFADFMSEMPNYERIEDTIHDLMVYNPRIEIYVLDAGGRVLSWFSEPDQVVRDHVDTGPIQTFLRGGFSFPLLGDDPRSPDGQKPFSATPIDVGDQRGFLYVILGGELVDASLSATDGSHITRLFLAGMVLILIGSAIVGTGLLFLHTRRFQVMKNTVRRFASGETSARIPVRRHDDVAQLSRTFNDMADRIEAALENLRQTDQLRRDQVANISHDLKTPLSSILGFVETIEHRGDTLSPDDRARYLKVIRDNAQTLGRLVSELSELARLDSLNVKLEKESFNLQELVQDVVMSLEPMAQARQVDLRTDLSDNNPRVRADLGMIERVLTNLVRNAIQYTPEGGSVMATVREEGPGVRVEISDTGCGIPREELPLVTQRFYRVDKSRASGAGMGLGLSIAETILQLHDAHLTITSENGRGTTISFRLGLDGHGDE